MLRSIKRRLLILFLVPGLLGALSQIAWAGNPPPVFYQVTLLAPNREARSRLASQGVAIDAIGPETVTTIVDAAGLARLREQGLRPLAITPLDFPPASAHRGSSQRNCPWNSLAPGADARLLW